MEQFTCYCRLTHLQLLRGLSDVQICLHSCCVIVPGVFFLLLLCSISYILVMLARFCAILLFLWTAVSARILALVLQLYERNKLNWKNPSRRLLVAAAFIRAFVQFVPASRSATVDILEASALDLYHASTCVPLNVVSSLPLLPRDAVPATTRYWERRLAESYNK